MSKPASRTELIDYAKRQLGAPVLEINVADEQISDLLDDAFQFWNERHYDGVVKMPMKYQFTEDDISRGNGTVGIVTTNALIYSPLFLSSTPITPASRISGWVAK